MNQDRYNFKTYVVRSSFLCGFLILMGHPLKSIAPDRDRPNKNVFYFNNNPLLLKDINENYPNFKTIINPILNEIKEDR